MQFLKNLASTSKTLKCRFTKKKTINQPQPKYSYFASSFPQDGHLRMILTSRKLPSPYIPVFVYWEKKNSVREVLRAGGNWSSFHVHNFKSSIELQDVFYFLASSILAPAVDLNSIPAYPTRSPPLKKQNRRQEKKFGV